MIDGHPYLGIAGRIAVAVLLVTTLGSIAGATTDGDGDDSGTEEVGPIDLTIEDERITVEDVHLTGPGLPDKEIDERTYTIDEATISSDDLTVTFRGTTYEIEGVEIVLEDVEVGLRDVSFGSS